MPAFRKLKNKCSRGNWCGRTIKQDNKCVWSILLFLHQK